MSAPFFHAFPPSLVCPKSLKKDEFRGETWSFVSFFG
jgi:hypothetical protein